MQWRWLECSVAEPSPEMNMAIDAMLFDRVAKNKSGPVVRLYRWHCPVVTIGRLQDADAAGVAFPGMTLVRRPTGGRAVAHGDDLTISVALSPNVLADNAGRSVLASYFAMLDGVLDALREVGVEASVGGNQPKARGPMSARCFDHIGRCDVFDVRTGVKILGCAQRRTSEAILQQMSLPPLTQADLLGVPFKDALRIGFERALGINTWKNDSGISESERVQAAKSSEQYRVSKCIAK